MSLRENWRSPTDRDPRMTIFLVLRVTVPGMVRGGQLGLRVSTREDEAYVEKTKPAWDPCLQRAVVVDLDVA
jgi:hypothetical protein